MRFCTVLAAFVDVPDFAPAVAGLIGIGVGVDYALLVLTRFRAALETSEPRAAIREAVETAGRSVDRLKAAEQMSVEVLQGKGDMRQTVDAVMSAEQSFQAAVAIRDKIVTAYLEVSRMAI